MDIHVLASGSTGNAAFLKMGESSLLIDAGISARRISAALNELNTDAKKLDGILITHEHRDHIAGLPNFLKKYPVPVYARADTWTAIDNMLASSPIPNACRREIKTSLDINDLKIESFNVSHDAADPVGFTFHCANKKYAFATDLGFVTSTVKKALNLADALVLEANHDVDLLKQGSYPLFLKKRILSNRGHLANTDTGWTLARLARKNRLDVFLAHLSQENNRPHLAKETVNSILSQQNFASDETINLHVTYPNRPVNLHFAEEDHYETSL